MRILFMGGGTSPPTFITRRMAKLRETGTVVYQEYPVDNLTKYFNMPSGHVPVFHVARWQAIWSAVLSLFIRPQHIWHFIKIILNTGSQLSLPERFYRAFIYHRLPALAVDLVHFQWVGHLDSFGWLKPLLKVPFVASARGSMVTVYPTARPGYADVLKESLRMADAVHCVSADIKNACIRWGADAARCFVNYNGIDTSLFKPGQKTTTGLVKTITVGALMWRKGHPYQLLVIKDLLLRGLTLKHLIVGDGHEREGLRYLACRLGVDRQVDFAGSLVETEVIPRLQQAHLYISTSAAEGLSNSVMEAAACGLPVVAFDCEGMREIIVDGETGYIVPFGDITAMAEKIALLAGDTALRQRLGRQAREHVVARFDINRTVPEMIQLYQSVIDGSRHT